MSKRVDRVEKFIYKRAILLLSLFFLAHTTIFVLIYKFDTSTDIKYLKKLSSHTLYEQSKIIDTHLSSIKMDLTLLSNEYIFTKYLENNTKYKEDTQEYLKRYMSQKGIYDQIRYIDIDGNEKLRVNYNNGTPVIVKDNNLQNKRDRYYFINSINLQKSNIYISPFDLNIERGEIEKPIKPMIRFAMPIFKDNKKVGVLVINYLGNKLLSSLTSSFINFDGHVSLLNKDSYWILSNDEAKEWGFMYKTKKHINYSRVYPDEWDTISSYTHKDFESKNGYHTFITINVSKDISWKVVVTIPISMIDSIKSSTIQLIIPLYIFILLLGGISLITYIKTLKRRHVAQARIDLMSQVFKYSKEGILITNSNLEILEVNKAFTSITGYSFEELKLKKPSVLQSKYHNKEFYQDMWESLAKHDYWEGEIKNRKKCGEIFLEWLRIYKVKDGSNVLSYIGIFSDITEQKEIENEIYRLAHYDSLTKLPNRHLFNITLADMLNKANTNETKLALLFIDLDNFKYINDAFGHIVGDLFLQNVSKRINNIITDKNHIARLGGDEFVVIIDKFDDIDDLKNSANTLIHTLAQPFLINKEDIFTSASIGIAIYPDDATESQELIKHADIAMYLAKNSGKNNYQIFNKELESSTNERFAIESKLHKAVENSEFILHFQPQIDTITKKIVGFESLIRWQNPIKGIISPQVFIPIAEETGLINPIGAWVVEETFKYLNELHAKELYIDASINISSIQLKHPMIVDTIDALANSYNINPKYIKLEVTESILMENIEEYISTLDSLNSLGFRISIDDFGTGYSSLNYLRKLPIDELKIDKSFIQDILKDKNNAQIVSAIISIAKSLELNVVAEGVEEYKEVEILSKLECDKIQGFYYSKPLDKDNFNSFIQNFNNKES
jgi:diguanylate cyclase (GGDEF)-like protein/PAS domain S-box-containing protein